jgi:hypothetical protein
MSAFVHPLFRWQPFALKPFTSAKYLLLNNKNNMRIVTDDYQDFQLLNLGTNKNGHGPYVIRQDGVPPGSSSSQEDRFLLRKDGTWIRSGGQIASGKKSRGT